MDPVTNQRVEDKTSFLVTSSTLKGVQSILITWDQQLDGVD
jgi:hypothetical protein